jgi:3-oxoacyl-[acyl-carrier-protein] synthase II
MDRYAQFAVAAARLAVADAGLPIDRDGEGIGAIIANGGSGSISREEQHRVLIERGPDRVSPFAIPLSVANMGAGQVSMELGLRGVVTAVCTACAAGTDAIGTALDVLRRGDARVMLAGGADTLISPYFVAGFDAMRVLSHRNDDPAGAARPFDRDRDGFLVGEAGAVMVLEPLDDARARGAEVICELAGYGATADAYHITDPDPTGEPQARAVTTAIEDAGVGPDQVDHVNAHGGGSKPGDPTELRALRLALGDEAAARVAVSATKSMHGHCMGATGALEAAITALALREGVVPPTINLREVDPTCLGVDHVANEARAADLRVAMSTSFGLGGHNAALVLTRAEDGDR